jgi:pimeloyl-ACP methyl ester carboxylesterase
LFGDNDWMSKDGAERLVKDYNNMRLHKINDAGHQLIFDNPEEVTQKIREVVHE